MRSRIEKIDEEFKRELDDVIGEHRKRGNKISYRRVTKAMIRTSLWQDMKVILKNSEIKNDNLR